VRWPWIRRVYLRSGRFLFGGWRSGCAVRANDTGKNVTRGTKQQRSQVHCGPFFVEIAGVYSG